MKIQVPYEERISRLAFFRFLWTFVIVWPMSLWFFWLYLLSIAYVVVLLFKGKRYKYAWDRLVQFYQWQVRWTYYIATLNEEKPGFLPWEEEV